MSVAVEIREGPLTGDAPRPGGAASRWRRSPTIRSSPTCSRTTRARDRSVGLLHRAVIVNLAARDVLRTAYLGGQGGRRRAVDPAGRAGPIPPMLQVRQLLTAVRVFLPNFGSFARAGRILRSVELGAPQAAAVVPPAADGGPVRAAPGDRRAPAGDDAATPATARACPRGSRRKKRTTSRTTRGSASRWSKSTARSATRPRCGRCRRSPAGLISRPSPPSAARSGGSTPPRTPSAACA